MRVCIHTATKSLRRHGESTTDRPWRISSWGQASTWRGRNQAVQLPETATTCLAGDAIESSHRKGNHQHGRKRHKSTAPGALSRWGCARRRRREEEASSLRANSQPTVRLPSRGLGSSTASLHQILSGDGRVALAEPLQDESPRSFSMPGKKKRDKDVR